MSAGAVAITIHDESEDEKKKKKHSAYEKQKERAGHLAQLAHSAVKVTTAHPGAQVELCAEDTTIEPPFEFKNNEPVYAQAVRYRTDHEPKQVWSTAMKESKNPDLPFPSSGILYENRIRRRAIDMEFEGDADTLLDKIRCEIPVQALRGIFLRCKKSHCAHRIVPLSIDVVNYKTEGVSSKLALQVTTEYCQVMNDDHSGNANDSKVQVKAAMKKAHKGMVIPSHNAWIPNTTAYIGSTSKGPSVLDAYGFALEGNTKSNERVRVYTANKENTIPENYDTARALSYRSYSGIGPEKYILRFASDEEHVYVQVPNRRNQTPSVVSYLVTKGIARKEQGLNKNNFEVWTRRIPTTTTTTTSSVSAYINNKKKKKKSKKKKEGVEDGDEDDDDDDDDDENGTMCWRYKEDSLYDILMEQADRLTRMHIFMDIDHGGMLVEWRPLDPHWKPTGTFKINLKLEFVYIVTNG